MRDISVVIAVKNRSDYLTQAMNSIQTQTIDNWECIIVDDYSDENISEAVEKMNDDRFVYYKNPNKPGISSARNFGNTKASSKWIAVADSDDINVSNRLELTLNVFNNNDDADAMYGSIKTFSDKSPTLKISMPYVKYNRDLLYETNFIPHIASAYKTSIVNEIKYNENLESSIDYDLWLSFADLNKKIVSIPDLLTLYRKHDEQISSDPVKHKKQYENSFLVMNNHSKYR